MHLVNEIILYLYFLVIPAAFLSYFPQQLILIDMIRGKRPVSRDISSAQLYLWTATNLIGVAHALFNVQDIAFITVSSANFLNNLITALLNTYVQKLYRKKQRMTLTTIHRTNQQMRHSNEQ